MNTSLRFEIATIEHEGRLVRGVSVHCATCSAKAVVRMNIIRNSTPRDQNEKLVRIATRKFESIGWFLGRNSSSDFCPSCRRSAGQPKPTLPQPEKVTMIQATKSPCEEKPRQMAIDDALTIASKLQEVYLGADKGYGDGNTDAKVAESLGVPRAWVKEVRIKSYGVNSLGGNDDIADALRQAQEACKDGRAILAEMAAIAEQRVAPFRARLDAIERRIVFIASAIK